MENLLVSVIVVCYNHSKFIVECLNSIKNQTYANWELIVADDASTDNSVEIIKEWLKENNISAKTNFHTKNTGLATTLNECIKLLKGEFVKLIAADDYLHPDSIENCIAAMEKSGDDYGMVFTDFWAVDENNTPAKIFLSYENKDFINPDHSLKKDQLVKYNCIIAPTVLIKKDILLSTGEYAVEILLEDYDRWLRINEIKKILFIDKKLAYYRILPSGVTSTRNARMVEEDLYIRMKYDKFGTNKIPVYHFILSKFKKKEKISDLLINEYYKYPFRVKSLVIALKINLNPRIYIMFLKLNKKWLQHFKYLNE
ncbi:glycosyltransferase family 2 protein [Flavobacterium sp. B17]|uniref:glycosyltransferase family 2 protein n=1 Tax=Flavobacterium sp. B17 TaxID=95618 RepID=UPI000347A1EB|nr:glycosyltransferase family 2 protein [Flavobacterium sp. B17]